MKADTIMACQAECWSLPVHDFMRTERGVIELFAVSGSPVEHQDLPARQIVGGMVLGKVVHLQRHLATSSRSAGDQNEFI